MSWSARIAGPRTALYVTRVSPFREPFASFVAYARPTNEVWRLATGLVLCLFIYITLLLGLDSVVSGISGAPAFSEPVTTPWAMIYLLFTFVGMALGPILVVVLLHNRTPGSLLGHRGGVFADFLVAAGTMLAVQFVFALVYGTQVDVSRGLAFDTWLLFLPLALPALAIQTGAEELLFRGYLLQQVAARFRSPWVWGLGPALLFGLLHYDSALEPTQIWMIIAAIVVFALLTTDLVTVTGSLGAAWGMHFALNFSSLLVLAPDTWLSGLALYRADIPDAQFGWLILIDTTAMLLGWWLVRQRVQR